MQLPGYRIERLIAEGGMASVYLAVQESLDRYVALKVLKRFDSPTQTLRFFNEGRIIASLNHHNIITIYDIGAVDERHYIAMEYLEGGDLKQRIADGMKVDEALDLLETLGSCLDFVHGKGIVHRDIKPENILFHEDGIPIITDFGIAKQSEVDSSLTLDGMALGSPYYLSPEQAGCKALDGRTDLYSLGIIFYEMITGDKPYQGDSPIDIIMAHMTSPIPTLPPALRSYQCLLERMIAKQPDDRFDSAETLVEYVQALRETGPIGAAAEKLSGFLHRFTESEPEEKVHDSMDQPKQDPAAAFGLKRASANLGSLQKYRVDFLSEISTPAKTASTAMLVTLLIAGSLYGLQSKPAAQPPPVAIEETIAIHEDVESLEAEDVEPLEAEQERWIIVQDEIEDDLKLAAAALKDYRLTTPAKKNAYYYYQRVLKRDPMHPTALQGMEEIGNAYADLAASALDNYEYSKAKTYLHRGLRVQPDNNRLLALNQRTNAIRDVGSRFFGQIKSVFD